MKLIRVLALMLLVLTVVTARAADEPAATVPNPAMLPGDWWTYFEPKEPIDDEALQKRVTAANRFLAELTGKLRSAGQVQEAEDAGTIQGDLKRFLAVKTTPAPVPSPLAPAPDTYTLDEALEQFNEWQTLKQQVDAAAEETDWLASVLGERRKQQSRLRSQYLELNDDAPERLSRGLALMRKRVALELQRLDLDRRKALLEQASEQLAGKQAQLDNIPARLVATQKEIARWEGEARQAQAALDKQRAERERTTLSYGAREAPTLDLTDTRYTGLVITRRDIETRILELRASRAQMAVSLLRLVEGNGAVSSKAVRADIDEFRALGATVAEQQERWERIVRRVRLALEEPGAKTDGTRDKRSGELQQLLADTDQALRRLQREKTSGEFITRLLTARLQADEGWLRHGVKDFSDTFLKSGAYTLGLLGATLFEINETPVTTLGLLRVALILTIAMWASRIIRRGIHHVGEKRGTLNQSSLYTFGRLIHYLVLAIGIIIGLSSIGIDFTKFALFASALGVGIGFGLQTLISNFVAGLIILFEKSLKVGDFVELESGVTGEVREINMRSTLITTNDNVDILVPNSEFVGGRVTNWTLREAHRRVRIPFGVAYGTDKDKVRKAVLEAAENVQWTLKNVKARKPQVWFVEFGDSSLNFELVVWLTPEAVKRPGAVTATYLWEIDTKLREYHIEVPFPQRDLHLRSAFGRTDEAAIGMFETSAPQPDP